MSHRLGGFLFDERQQVVDPTAGLILAGASIRIANPQMPPAVARITAVHTDVVLHRQAELFELLLTQRPASGLACGLDGR